MVFALHMSWSPEWGHPPEEYLIPKLITFIGKTENSQGENLGWSWRNMGLLSFKKIPYEHQE
jgi:hypothetical protein